jgi:phosphate:Na+ symporter
MLDFQNSQFIILLAGVCFFLYGASMASSSLEKLMASRITSLMNKISTSSFLSISVGVVLTAVLQSSGAVTSMLVSLGRARVIKLPQVMGIIIGTAIGTTLTVQLISFDLGVYALPLFVMGFMAFFIARKPSIKTFATVVMGFALLFMGLKMISISAHYFSKPSRQCRLFLNSIDDFLRFCSKQRGNNRSSDELSQCRGYFCSRCHALGLRRKYRNDIDGFICGGGKQLYW